MPKPHPAAFRRQALALLDDGRTVRDVAASLGVAHSCLRPPRRRHQHIEQRVASGVSDGDPSELAAAKQRIRDLEEQVKILRKAAAAVEWVVPQMSVSASSRNWQMKECGSAKHATRSVSHRRGSTTGKLGRRPRA